MSTGKMILLGVGGLMVLGYILGGKEKRDSASVAHQASAAAPVAAAENAIVLPMNQGQQYFCSLISNFSQKYSEAKSGGGNELVLSKLRVDRKKVLAKLDETSAREWVGTLSHLSTTGAGAAVVAIKLPCTTSVVVKTHNMDAFDGSAKTLIQQSSPMFDALSSLKVGSAVKFSGAFILGGRDHFEEVSLGESGAMLEPEFIYRFSAIFPL